MKRKLRKVFYVLAVAGLCFFKTVPVFAADEDISVAGREFESITPEEYNLLARCVMAESGGEPSSVQEKVCEVILNRVDSNRFPNTIQDVIYEKNQFSVVNNGSIDIVNPTERVYDSISVVLKQRTLPSDVVFFNSIGYFSFANPYCQDGNMWFSSIR